MPAVSKAQHKFMGLCSSHKGRAKAKGKCPPMSVAKEYAHTSGKRLPEKAKKRKF
jgi:hypothetical protein